MNDTRTWSNKDATPEEVEAKEAEMETMMKAEPTAEQVEAR